MNEENQNIKKNVLETEFEYDKEHTFDNRLAETKNALEKYPTRVPILVKMRKGSGTFHIEKCKFLVPEELTVAQFLMIIRKRIAKLESNQAIWMFCNGIIPPTTESVGSLYNRCKSKDGFLRIVCSEENVFG